MAPTLRQLALRDLPEAEAMLAEGEARLECLREHIAEYDRRGLKLPHSKRLMAAMIDSYELQAHYVATLREEIAQRAPVRRPADLSTLAASLPPLLIGTSHSE